MALTYYKPNSNNKGSLLSINFSAKADKFEDGKTVKGDKSFYFRLVAQTAWNDKEKTGSFKDGRSIVVKLSPVEVSGIILAVTKNTTLASSMGQEYVYHDGDKTATTIYFGPHFKKIQVDGKWVDSDKQVGYSLRVVKTEKANKDNKEQLSVGLTYAEAEQLVRFLSDGLAHIFSALYSEDVNRGKLKKSTSIPEPAEPEAPESNVAEEPPDDPFSS